MWKTIVRLLVPPQDDVAGGPSILPDAVRRRLQINLVAALGVSVLVLAACVPLNVSTADPNLIQTAIAQTMAAWTPTIQPLIPVTNTESPTPSPSPTATLVTDTATPVFTETLSPTPVFTSTPPPLIVITVIVTSAVPSGAPQVQVSIDTNCRTGPGVAYPRVGGLNVGEVAEVVGRNAAGTYWIIRNPDRPGELCWLWGRYATVTGNTSGLTVYTPPVTPTPVAGFDVFYDGLESCSGTGWWVDLNVENLGGLTFRSISLTVRDRENDTVLSLSTNGFTDRTGCSETTTRDNLPADANRTVSSPVFGYDLTGHRLRATIKLCSNTAQTGTCITQTVNFTP